jgi:hypothetical protein
VATTTSVRDSGSISDLAVAEVHHDVARVGVSVVGSCGEQQVTRLDVSEWDGRAVLTPAEGGPGDVDARSRIDSEDQA